MSEEAARSSTTFATIARQHVRTALELAVQRSPDASARVAAELSTVALDADLFGLDAIATLARRGCEQAQALARGPLAVTALARTLRELARVLDSLAHEARDVRRGKVLIVDDSALNASVIRDALDGAAFDTQIAGTCDAAAVAVGRFAPDVVLADVHMPDCTPGELCTRVRAAAGGRALHVLLCSGLEDDELAVLARAIGADGFVSKERGLGAVVGEVTRAYRSVAG